MPPKSSPDQGKKSDLIGLRLEPVLRKEFTAAAKASDLTIQDALRLAAQAMVNARQKLGRIPKDMEIRQATVGPADDAIETIRKAVEILFPGAPSLTAEKVRLLANLSSMSYPEGGRGQELRVAEAPDSVAEIEAAEVARRADRKRDPSKKHGA